MGKASLIAALLGMVIIVWGCGEPDVRFGNAVAAPGPAPAPAPAPVPTAAENAWRVPEKELNHLGLETVWTEKLYTQPRETVIDAYVLGDLVVMETAARKLYGIDRKTGTPKWTVEIPNRCDFRGCEDEAQIYVPCRNVLVAIDKRGFITWRKFLEFAPGGIPVADAEHVYVPCFDGRMRAFLKDSGYFAWQYTTNGEIESRPAVGFRLVYAGSNDGTLYALTTDKLDLSWDFKTYGAIRAGVLYDKMRVFVASTDGSLYSLVGQPQATREQQLAWNVPYATGAAIDKTPFLAPDMVLVINRNRQCHAVDRSTGRKLWVVADADEALTQGKLNTYLLRGNARILAVDNKTGNIRWQLDTPAGAFGFFLANASDDTLYLVKKSGEIQAVREQRLGKPAPAPVKEGAPAKEAKPADKPAEGGAAAE